MVIFERQLNIDVVMDEVRLPAAWAENNGFRFFDMRRSWKRRRRTKGMLVVGPNLVSTITEGFRV